MSEKWHVERGEQTSISEDELEKVFMKPHSVHRSQDSLRLESEIRYISDKPNAWFRLRLNQIVSEKMSEEEIERYLINLRGTIGSLVREYEFPYMVQNGKTTNRRAYQTGVFERDGYKWLWVRRLPVISEDGSVS